MARADKWGVMPDASTWRELATRLWPNSVYANPSERVAFVLFDMARQVVEAHRANDEAQLERIYGFARWSFEQGKRDAEIGDLPVTAFYEHLVDAAETLVEIPKRIPPDVFDDLRAIF